MSLFGRGLYRFGVFLARLWARICGMRVMGKEHIPREAGPLLLVANHTSSFDPIILAILLPRHVTFIAKEAFGRRPFTHWLFGTLGAVFLNKEESDLSALRTSINLLKQGRVVSIFPEGHRQYDQMLSDFMPGAGYIALKTGAPVLPVAILNSGNMRHFWKRNVAVSIGPAQTYSVQGRASQEYIREVTGEMRRQVAALYAQNQVLLQNSRQK